MSLTKRRLIKLFMVSLLLGSSLLLSVNSFADTDTPVGYWKQYSDKTQQLQSIIQIWNKNGVLFGKVIKSFAMNGVPPKKYCTDCPGELKNQPILGMIILGGFKQDNAIKWTDGRILDPDSGSIYRCTMTLKDNGQMLDVHGYIGVPLLGRTQEWVRTNSLAINKS